MNRRTLLKLLAAVTAVGCRPQALNPVRSRVVIAGAGIIGASIAYYLSKMGTSVTVIDKEGPATHASRGTFAWINATWAKQPRHYHALNQDGLANWRSLQQALNLQIRWHGSLEWFEQSERQRQLAEQIAEQFLWGERARMIGAREFHTLEPGVVIGDAQQVAYSGNDGAINPVAATKALLAAAEKNGAIIKYPCELTGVSESNGRLDKVVTSLGEIKADKLVLATGADPAAGRRFAGIDIPQRSTAGVIAITAPMPPLINRIIVAPGIHMHQRIDGRIILGEQGGAPGNDAHAIRLQDRPREFPTQPLAEQHAQRMLEIAKRFVPQIGSATIEHVYIGWRPLPLDGHPVLGASPARPDVYFAIMHSGVSLAPVVGQLVAYELAERHSLARLEAYRPDRKFEQIRRY